jgi:hypothetical protein
MVMSYSQGQTEGRINKLKLVKRSMYGRGEFDLLRQHVLYAASQDQRTVPAKVRCGFIRSSGESKFSPGLLAEYRSP